MDNDPFGDLMDWGLVLDRIEALESRGELAGCQPGLIRILRYKGNWRLREAVLTRVGAIADPSADLTSQVLAILDDDNTYFDARILAAEALMAMFKNTDADGIHGKTADAIEKLKRTPQPPIFADALNALGAALMR